MIWVQYESEHIRDSSIKKLAKPSFKFKSSKIWAEKDLKFEQRQLISLLLGIRRNFIEQGLEKSGLWIEKDAFQLSYYDDWIISVYTDTEEKTIKQEMNPEWVEYICEGNVHSMFIA